MPSHYRSYHPEVMGVSGASGPETQGQVCILEPSLGQCRRTDGERRLESVWSVRDSCKSRRGVVTPEPGQDPGEKQRGGGESWQVELCGE